MGFGIFEWEQETIEWMKAAPRSGVMFDFMHFISDFSTTKWIILVAIILLGIWKGWKVLRVPIGLSLVAAILGDLVSRRFIKAYFMRPRPEFLNEACDLSACWGFISSHSTNVFAVLTIIFFVDKRTLCWTLPLALLVSFSRIYLIDHYPLDVLGGAVMGILIGLIVWILFQKILERQKGRLLFLSENKEMPLIRHSLLVSIFAMIMCVFSIFYSDQSVAQVLANPPFLSFRQWCWKITDVALGGYYFGISALTYTTARWILPNWKRYSDRPKLIAQIRSAGAFSFLALFFAGLIVLILKIAFGRQRPHVSETFDSFHFEPINFHWYWHSFPSGHAQVVFVVATIMSLTWPKLKWWFLMGAIILAFTRVATHQHFLSDTIFGGLIGYIVTIGLYSRWKKNQKELT